MPPLPMAITLIPLADFASPGGRACWLPAQGGLRDQGGARTQDCHFGAPRLRATERDFHPPRTQAEKFPTTLRWYVDVILQLITLAGDHVSEDIWYRVVQIVTNNDGALPFCLQRSAAACAVDGLQEYAATTLLKALQSPDIHESGIKVGGYILGEFGHQIKNEVRGNASQQIIFLATHAAGRYRCPTSQGPLRPLPDVLSAGPSHRFATWRLMCRADESPAAVVVHQAGEYVSGTEEPR